MYHAPRQSGKTTRLMALCNRLCKQGKMCRVFSLETVPCTPFVEFKDELTLGDDQVVLLIDEFDVVAAHPDKDAVLRHLRAQHQTTGKACICFGAFEIFTVDLKSANGSPFNIKKGIAASPFSLEQVSRLIREFANEYEVSVDDDVVGDIFAATGGHRSLVTSAGYCLQQIVLGNSAIKRICLVDWARRESDFAHKIVASSSFNRQRSRLLERGYSCLDIYWMFINIARVSLLGLGLDPVRLQLAILLSDIGMLLPADEGQYFRIGPPALQQLVHAIAIRPLVTIPRDLDMSSQPCILKVVMAKALPLALKLRDGGAKKKREEAPVRDDLPDEEAYCLAFAHMWGTFLSVDTLRPQIKAQDANKPVDYVAIFPGCEARPAVVEFVAHSRPGPEDRPSSVLEHLKRVDKDYRKIVGPNGSLWVINIALKDVRDKYSTLAHPGVCTLHVFHSDDPGDVEFVFHDVMDSS